MDPGRKTIVVIGGGMSGMTTALEAAEAGASVHLVESGPSLGGRVAALARYFPKMCPPTCGIEINYRRIRRNPDVVVHTLTRVTQIEGRRGAFRVTLRTEPRRVNARCTACGECVAVCPVERPDAFNYGIAKTKAIYLPHAMAYPFSYVVDAATCKGAECSECVRVCKYAAVDLGEQPVTRTVEAQAVVVATGWSPYDASRLENLGFGRYPNVITNVMMERMLAENGPTAGKPIRPSDGQTPKRIAYLQCAGSRDRNHLPYCSAVCCGASLKEAIIVREGLPDCEQAIFYIDRRVMGRNEDVLARVEADPKTLLKRGKAVQVTEDPASHTLKVLAEDTASGARTEWEADLVVLATGMVPNTEGLPLPAGCTVDPNGFLVPDGETSGVVAAGCVVQPAAMTQSMQEATGAALKALIVANV